MATFAFAQNDSVDRNFSVGIYPLNVLSPIENILFTRYNAGPISFELGGGVYNLFQPPSLVYVDPKSHGFTVQAAGIYYFDSKRYVPSSKGEGSWKRFNEGMYFKVLCFYRQVSFKDRRYVRDPDGIAETHSWGSYFFNGGSDYENETWMIADEKKDIIGIEGLMGNKSELGKHFFFDYYFGLGCRIKYRTLLVTKAHTITSAYMSPVNPPSEQKFRHIIPSFHLGVEFGYTF